MMDERDFKTKILVIQLLLQGYDLIKKKPSDSWNKGACLALHALFP